MQLVVEDFELMAPAGDLEPVSLPHDRRRVCRILPAVRRLLRGVHGEGRDHYHAAQLFQNRQTQSDARSPTLDVGEKRWSRRGLRFERGLPLTQWRPPIASWTRKDRGAALPKEQQKRFYYLCPDFVIELRSSTDRIRRLKAKMEEYIANGAELGWLIDPEERNVWIYRPGCAAECIVNPERISGEGPVASFVLELADVWA
jgi:Uma2 family endonuclease